MLDFAFFVFVEKSEKPFWEGDERRSQEGHRSRGLLVRHLTVAKLIGAFIESLRIATVAKESFNLHHKKPFEPFGTFHRLAGGMPVTASSRMDA